MFARLASLTNCISLTCAVFRAVGGIAVFWAVAGIAVFWAVAGIAVFGAVAGISSPLCRAPRPVWG